MIDESFRVELATWAGDEADLRAVREPVFIVEQQVPVEEEWDALDLRSVHVIARDPDGRPIGTGRLTPERKIGRMAVQREWRGRGVGDAMLRTLLEQARAMHYPEIVLHAQVDAIAFYERAGFVKEGAEFMEAGIRHQTMRLKLEPAAPLRRTGDRPPPSPRARHVDTDTLASAQRFADELAQDARHKLWIYTRDLDRLLYDREPFLELVRRVALSGRGAEVRVLVHDPIDAVRDGHRLLHLAARLPSYLHLRTPTVEEDRQYASAFLLNDGGGFLFRPIGSRYEGEGDAHGPGRHGALLAYFEQVWERSEPHPDLRRL